MAPGAGTAGPGGGALASATFDSGGCSLGAGFLPRDSSSCAWGAVTGDSTSFIWPEATPAVAAAGLVSGGDIMSGTSPAGGVPEAIVDSPAELSAGSTGLLGLSTSGFGFSGGLLSPPGAAATVVSLALALLAVSLPAGFGVASGSHRSGGTSIDVLDFAACSPAGAGGPASAKRVALAESLGGAGNGTSAASEFGADAA